MTNIAISPEVLEAAAKAIYETFCDFHGVTRTSIPWADLEGEERDLCFAQAGASLHAVQRSTMVLVPRIPTEGMLYCGEGMTDFILPDGFRNDKSARMEEMRVAWGVMVDQWLKEINVITKDSSK